MKTCKVCGQELKEKGLWMWKHPFSDDERKIHRDCLGPAYQLHDEARQQMRSEITFAIAQETGVLQDEAHSILNRVVSLEISERLLEQIELFHARFAPRKPVPYGHGTPSREMVGNLLTVRVPD